MAIPAWSKAGGGAGCPHGARRAPCRGSISVQAAVGLVPTLSQAVRANLGGACPRPLPRGLRWIPAGVTATVPPQRILFFPSEKAPS